MQNHQHCRVNDCWLLSQHMFGWPMFRPRLYTILTRKSEGFLSGIALNAIHLLYRAPCGPASDLLVAPAVPWRPSLKLEKVTQARGSISTFNRSSLSSLRE